MRKALVSIALLAPLAFWPASPVQADPPDPTGWQVTGGRTLTWTAPRPVPIGDAVVEFYSGDRRLGRPTAEPDQRTFTLTVPDAAGLENLQVRAGGRRLDAPIPRTTAAADPVLPAPLPANPVDPGVRGPNSTITGEYALAAVTLPDLPQPVEMRGLVVAPAGVTSASPLALFLHGRHFTCYTGPGIDKTTGDWPCPAGSTEVPSHRGYREAQELLASQGYVTVSISANGINGQDFAATDAGTQARSSLVRQHLGRWADWAADRTGAPAIVRQAPPADLSRVFLMGTPAAAKGSTGRRSTACRPHRATRSGRAGRSAACC